MAKRIKKNKVELQNPQQLRIGIVQAVFNNHITDQQLKSAQEALKAHGVESDVIEVAGCYEIAYALQNMAMSEKYDGLVALGCLIKGETIHFEVISNAIGEGVMELITKHNIPIGFGVITANDEQQAQDRVWIGEDATVAVLDLIAKTA